MTSLTNVVGEPCNSFSIVDPSDLIYLKVRKIELLAEQVSYPYVQMSYPTVVQMSPNGRSTCRTPSARILLLFIGLWVKPQYLLEFWLLDHASDLGPTVLKSVEPSALGRIETNR